VIFFPLFFSLFSKTHTHTQTLVPSLRHTHTHIHTHTHTHTQTLVPSLRHTHTHIHTHTHTHTHTDTCTIPKTHTHTHRHTLVLSLRHSHSKHCKFLGREDISILERWKQGESQKVLGCQRSEQLPTHTETVVMTLEQKCLAPTAWHKSKGRRMGRKEEKIPRVSPSPAPLTAHSYVSAECWH
jgi:hypothetical protein